MLRQFFTKSTRFSHTSLRRLLMPTSPPSPRATKDLVAALDIGTSSTRICVFDRRGSIVAQAQVPFAGQTTPRPGWCEHDPLEMIRSARECVAALGEDEGGRLRGDGPGMVATWMRGVCCIDCNFFGY
jgi:sugar (pentulose or hexulose) kinase